MTEPEIYWREDGVHSIVPPFTARYGYGSDWLEIEGWVGRRRAGECKVWVARAYVAYCTEKQVRNLARTLKTLALMRYEQRSLPSQQANINQL